MVHKWILKGLLFLSIVLVPLEGFKLTWVDYKLTPKDPELKLIRNALQLSWVFPSNNARNANVTLLGMSNRAPNQVLLYCNYTDVLDKNTTTYFYTAFTFKRNLKGVVTKVHLHAAGGFVCLQNTPLTPAHTNVVLTAAETYRSSSFAYRTSWKPAFGVHAHAFRAELDKAKLPNWTASQYCALENCFIAMFHREEKGRVTDDAFFAIFEEDNTHFVKLIKFQLANLNELYDKITKTLESGLAFNSEFTAIELDQPAPQWLNASGIPWIDNIQNARLHGRYDTKQGYIFEMYKSFGSLQSTFFVLYKGETAFAGEVLHVSLPAPVSKTVKIFQKFIKECDADVKYRRGIAWLNKKLDAKAVKPHATDILTELKRKHSVRLILEEIGILPIRDLNTKMYCVTYSLTNSKEGCSALLKVVKDETTQKEKVVVIDVSNRNCLHIMVANYYNSSYYPWKPVSAFSAAPKLPGDVISKLENAAPLTHSTKNGVDHLFTVAYGEPSSTKVRLVAQNSKGETVWLGEAYPLEAVDGETLEYNSIAKAQCEGEIFNQLMNSKFADTCIGSYNENSWATTEEIVRQPNMIWDLSEKFRVKIYADFTNGVNYRYEICISRPSAKVSDPKKAVTNVINYAPNHEKIITSEVFHSGINLLTELLQVKVRYNTAFHSCHFLPKITEAVSNPFINQQILERSGKGYTDKTSIFLDDSLDKAVVVFANSEKQHIITQYLKVEKKDLNVEYEELGSTYAHETVFESALASLLGDPFAFDPRLCWKKYEPFPIFEATEAAIIFEHAPWKIQTNEIFKLAGRSAYKEYPNLIITLCSLNQESESKRCFYVLHQAIKGEKGTTNKLLKVSGLGGYFAVIEACNSYLRFFKKFAGIEFNNGTTWIDPLAAKDLLKPILFALEKVAPGAKFVEKSCVVGEISVPIRDVLAGNVTSLVVVGELLFQNSSTTYATLIVRVQADSLEYIDIHMAKTHLTTFPCEYDIERYLQTRHRNTNL